VQTKIKEHPLTCTCFDGIGKCHDPWCPTHGGLNIIGKRNDDIIDFKSMIKKLERKSDGTIAIYFNCPIELVLTDDLSITLKGELGILSEDNICLDSKEVHLNSRNCKQIREMEQKILDALLDKIGYTPHIDEEKLQASKNQFKEEIIQEVMKRLSKMVVT